MNDFQYRVDYNDALTRAKDSRRSLRKRLDWARVAFYTAQAGFWLAQGNEDNDSRCFWHPRAKAADEVVREVAAALRELETAHREDLRLLQGGE